MDTAVQAADKVAKGDPTWLLAFLLIGLLMLNGLAVRTIFNVLFRSPNQAINDPGGIAHEMKAALIGFVNNVDHQIEKQGDSVRTLQAHVASMDEKLTKIREEIPTVCKSR